MPARTSGRPALAGPGDRRHRSAFPAGLTPGAGASRVTSVVGPTIGR